MGGKGIRESINDGIVKRGVRKKKKTSNWADRVKVKAYWVDFAWEKAIGI